jgi:ABC-type nitrate/sulfonate/bicarbonate transport system substrate-binding protein
VRAGLAKQEYDLAFIHPAHVALAEVKAGRYKAIAWTVGFTEYTVSLMVKANDPARALVDIKGKKLVTPDPDSITAWMVRAMLRSAKIGPNDLKIMTTRYQDAVPFYLEYSFADVGATAANAVVKEWVDKGGKVFLKSRAVPIPLHLHSSRRRAQIQRALTLRRRSAGRRAQPSGTRVSSRRPRGRRHPRPRRTARGGARGAANAHWRAQLPLFRLH